MDLIDILIIVALLYAAIRGYRRGLTYSLFSLLGLLVGLGLGAWLATSVPPLLHNFSVAIRSGIAIGLLVALALLGDGVGTWVGLRFRLNAIRSHWRLVDSIVGVAWGIVVVLLASWYLGLTFASGPWPPLSAQIQKSAILHDLARQFPQDPTWLGGLQHLFSAVPFPEVFANLVPPLPAPVQIPASLANDPAISAAAAETVKVVSVGCGGLLEGSGFPVAPGMILTNAHVVAGAHDSQVSVPGRSGSLSAEVVFFDPQRDIALLRVPSLNLTPLAISSSGARGTEGAVIGYPDGGVEQVAPGAIRGEMDAVGRDIYSNQIVSREIFVIQATVIPGNSGGPFVDLQGQVLGVVFAKSLDTSGEGYALTAGEVTPDISQGRAASRAVSTQSCVD
ncbi:MAG TPA: MarP family serine protease [Candidatus Dormibacteraeota bacterium]|nr:MarP family serine protease [Candidatus Dormibacteraeota bacterium]